jgi:cytosine/creatinine deaminase
VSLLLQGAMLRDAKRRDVRIVGSRIDQVGDAGTLVRADGDEVLDLAGYVLLPAPAEPHAHLDKVLSADTVGVHAHDLPGAIEAWHAHRETIDADEIAGRAAEGARMLLAHGATAVRTHVDVGPGIELRAADALVGVREALRDVMDIQVVALSYPLTGPEGEANVQRLREAAEIGVDLIGGAAHIDPDPTGSIDAALRVAAEAGLPIDLHMDEHTRDDLDLSELALRARDFAHAVTASHCVSLGFQPPEIQDEVARAVAAAGVGVVTLPQTNLYLQGRGQRMATPRGLTAIAALRAAGALVAGGGDNFQDPFIPIGAGDPLQTAQLLVSAAHVDVEGAYELVSEAARAVMGLPPVRVEPGWPAELLAVRASSLREAVATATEARLVIHAGRVVANTAVEQHTLVPTRVLRPVTTQEGAGNA